MGFPTIESALALWVEHAIHHEQALTGEILKVKAQEFADKMNINELVNRFPIDREEVRMEASEFVNSEDFISVQDMPTTVYYCNNRRRRLVGVRRLPNSQIYFS